MSNTALVTGASSGIGRELAYYHAERGGDVILVARREDALLSFKEELQSAHGITAHVFAVDLAATGGPENLIDQVTQANLTVDVLINNAGFGGQGAHLDRALEADLAMIDLNVRALVILTHAFGKRMVAAGGGKILNVSSTAAYMPGPYQAVYYATKAFVTSYSHAIDEEMRPKGVTCTALAPGMVDTGFAKAADLEGTSLTKINGPSARDVARQGYRGMLDGKLTVITETGLSLFTQWLLPLMPKRLVMRSISRAQQKS